MDSNTLVLVIILIAVIVSLAIALMALLSANKALKKTDRGRIEEIAKNEIGNYMMLNYNQRIKGLVQEEIARQLKIKEEPKVEAAKPSPPVVQVASVEEKPEETAPVRETETEKRPVEISLPEPVTLYTGICKDGAFKHVTTAPDNKTIYTIFADSKDAVTGILNVDQSAYDKIAQTPDYLQNACVYSGNGTQLKVTKTGTVQKENGTWVVKEPIVAEFN